MARVTFGRQEEICLPYLLDALIQLGFRRLTFGSDLHPWTESERSTAPLRKKKSIISSFLDYRVKESKVPSTFVTKQ
ncbi:hypothetical protein CJ010_19025 [Azoarcus sp. DD4]|nr:hypothetical protein CJ010_19025 [Azoarcus sp. DD4]